eukprot:7364397-Prymnesium_polylepis.3
MGGIELIVLTMNAHGVFAAGKGGRASGSGACRARTREHDPPCIVLHAWCLDGRACVLMSAIVLCNGTLSTL